MCEAQKCFDDLKCFEGGDNQVIYYEPPGPKHDMWVKGMNSATGPARALRILVPLGMVVDILEHASLRENIQKFTESGGGAECKIEDLRHPHFPVWWLRKERGGNTLKYFDTVNIVCHQPVSVCSPDTTLGAL